VTNIMKSFAVLWIICHSLEILVSRQANAYIAEFQVCLLRGTIGTSMQDWQVLQQMYIVMM
jgi:hypothetical protein